jgi:hypothetical protein
MTYKLRRNIKTDNVSVKPKCSMKDSESMAKMIENSTSTTKEPPKKK